MQDSIGSFSAIRGMPRVEQYTSRIETVRVGAMPTPSFKGAIIYIPYATPEAATNNGASRLSMINAAITIIYRPKTMFHGVSTPMAGRLGWTVSFGLSYPSLHTRVESAVSTFSLPLAPLPSTRHGRIYAKISECLRGVPLRA